MFSRFTLIECCKVNNLVNKRRSFDGAETPDSTPRSLWSHLATSASKACNFFCQGMQFFQSWWWLVKQQLWETHFCCTRNSSHNRLLGEHDKRKCLPPIRKSVTSFWPFQQYIFTIGEDFSVSSRSCRDPAHCFQLRAYRCTVFLGLHSLTWTP